MIIKELLGELTLADPGLVGCRRRGAWSKGEVPTWRWVRGNALLYVLGQAQLAKTPVGPLEFYVTFDDREERLLQFRGGKWNPDWVEDFYDLWALAHEYRLLKGIKFSRKIIVVHEDRGELDIKEVDVPEAMCPERRVEKIMAEYQADPPGRIPKSGSRAAKVCKWCPFKQRCDSEDILRGETNDWSSSYPIP